MIFIIIVDLFSFLLNQPILLTHDGMGDAILCESLKDQVKSGNYLGPSGDNDGKWIILGNNNNIDIINWFINSYDRPRCRY